MKTVYFEKVKHMLAEMFAMKKRKAMHPALNVFTFIVTIPFFALFLVAALVLLGLVIVFEVLETPAKYLDEFLSKRGEEVEKWTQTFMYILTWPCVFALKAMIAFVTLLMNAAYVLTVMLGYVWTLGGVKFHLSILEEGYELKEQENITRGRPLGLIIPGMILMVLGIAVMVLCFVFPSVRMYASATDATQIITLMDYLLLMLAPVLFGVQFTVADAVAAVKARPTLTTITTQYELAYYQFSFLFMLVGIALLAVWAAYTALYVPLAFNNAKKSK